MKVKLIFIDPEKKEAKTIACENNKIEDFAHEHVAKTLDSLVCYIGDLKTKFYVYCDDNWTNDYFVSASTPNGDPFLYGKLLVCKLDSTGVISLTDEDIDYIKRYLATEFVWINENEFKIENTILIKNVTQTTI